MMIQSLLECNYRSPFHNDWIRSSLPGLPVEPGSEHGTICTQNKPVSFQFYAIVIILAFNYLELDIEFNAGIVWYTTALNNPVHGVWIHFRQGRGGDKQIEIGPGEGAVHLPALKSENTVMIIYSHKESVPKLGSNI